MRHPHALLFLGIAALGRASAAPVHAQDPAFAWASCRAITPSTLQLVWHPAPGATSYVLTLRPAAGAAIRAFPHDTTFTQTGLPDGALDIELIATFPPAGKNPAARPGPLHATAQFPVVVTTNRNQGVQRCAA